jgi:hypothetical protein
MFALVWNVKKNLIFGNMLGNHENLFVFICSLEKLATSNVEDSVIQLIHDNIGKFYLERQNWLEAQKAYEKSKNNACISYCLYKLGDWEALQRLITLPEKDDPVLLCIANYFWNVGMCNQAVSTK